MTSAPDAASPAETSRVAVLQRIPEVGIRRLRDAGLHVDASEREAPLDASERAAVLADATAAVTLLTDRVDDAFLDEAPHLRIVANVAVGFDNVDVAACAARGVVVTNTPGVLTDATADLTLALLLAVTRRVGEGERLIRSGAPWSWGMFMMLGRGLRDRRLGIVGMGAIGTAVAERARAFGMRVAYHNRSAVDAEVADRLGAERLDLDELFATSDVVSLHCPHTPETHHLVDARRLASMRDDAYLVNTARGPVVDEAALVAALDGGQIAGAALDVYENEPEVHPGLVDRDDVVLLPHLGSATIETRDAMSDLAARNVVAVLAGERPITPVAPPAT
ncbi:MAG: D-glycerate dehydrogenase [Actinomycetota bacterium]